MRNRLAKESSPYLLQHAHNPVDWFPWGDEAFEKAKAEDKPILVSIGYSTCHWCHVMERESFEDETVAAFMNEYFINIKVDREERPDVDSIYMEAIQMINGGHGGWPLNCFLLPDGRPFFGGTYFPPRQAHGRASWMMVLNNIQTAYNKRRNEVLAQAEKIMSYIASSDSYFVSDLAGMAANENPFDIAYLEQTFNVLKQGFDSIDGGFGHAPKFPSVMPLLYCLNYHHYTANREAMEHLQLSLDAMIYGGIYDQIGGGFARYSVDKVWLAPHFEKMLYDNALLVSLLADAYKATGKALYRETIEETLVWVEREMLSEEGGFYSALDADSEGVEGKFYVWSKEEVEHILGEEAALFCQFYDLSEEGNWEETNILRRLQSFVGFAKQHGIAEAELRTKMKAGRDKLLSARAGRIRPGLDDKILLAWNALMCTAYCKAYQATGTKHYRDIAEKNMAFLLEKFSNADGSILHDYKNGKAKNNGFLDDYALLIEALLACYEISFDKKYLEKADALCTLVLAEFLDRKDQLFFYTGENQKDIIIRKKDLYDSATPSGNATMIQNLLALGILLNKSEYREQALASLLPLRDSLCKHPQSFGRWVNTLFSMAYPSKEIAIVGDNFEALAAELQRHYIPAASYCAAASADAQLPLLEGRTVAAGKTLIFVCSDYTCRLPVDTVEAALGLV